MMPLASLASLALRACAEGDVGHRKEGTSRKDEGGRGCAWRARDIKKIPPPGIDFAASRCFYGPLRTYVSKLPLNLCSFFELSSRMSVATSFKNSRAWETTRSVFL